MYSAKAYSSPSRAKSFLPRHILHPSRISVVLAMLLIILFMRWHFPDGYISCPPATAPGLLRPPDEPPVPKARVAIVTFTTRQQSYTQLSLKNHFHYARKHGYDFIVDFEMENKRGAMWHKFVMVESAIATGQYDWVWWMDFDTLITNNTIKVEDVIEESLANLINPDLIDFIFTADCFELNAGSFLTRGHTRSVAFFNAVRAYHDDNATEDHQLSEQDCMRDIIFRGSKPFSDNLIFIPQWKLNAFPEEIKCWDSANKGWERGMFVLHFAGAWAHVHEDDPTGFLMDKYERDIIW